MNAEQIEQIRKDVKYGNYTNRADVLNLIDECVQLRRTLARLEAAASDLVLHPAHISPLDATITRLNELNAAIAEAHTALGRDDNAKA